jgi:hypothetical protein
MWKIIRYSTLILQEIANVHLIETAMECVGNGKGGGGGSAGNSYVGSTVVRGNVSSPPKITRASPSVKFEVSWNEAKSFNKLNIEKAMKPQGTGYIGKSYSGTRNTASDFTRGNGKSTLTKHFNDHKGDFGFTTEAQYLKGARNFLEKSPTSTTQSFVSKEGTYFRYDTATNEFGIINQYGGISTYYKPTDGIKYWKEQFGLYAPK